MDDLLKTMRAPDALVRDQLKATEGNVGSGGDLISLIAGGQVGSVMVNKAEFDGFALRLQSRGVTVYGNAKVPRGYAAVYDKTERMVGLYRLAA
jgi:hypothetical protein